MPVEPAWCIWGTSAAANSQKARLCSVDSTTGEGVSAEYLLTRRNSIPACASRVVTSTPHCRRVGVTQRVIRIHVPGLLYPYSAGQARHHGHLARAQLVAQECCRGGSVKQPLVWLAGSNTAAGAVIWEGWVQGGPHLGQGNHCSGPSRAMGSNGEHELKKVVHASALVDVAAVATQANKPRCKGKQEQSEGHIHAMSNS